MERGDLDHAESSVDQTLLLHKKATDETSVSSLYVTRYETKDERLLYTPPSAQTCLDI